MGVAEAAVELGVSDRRVRQMLADGVLRGERVGRAWVIESDQLRHAGHRRPRVGRPWSAASAWALLALADGESPKLSPVERSRARKRLSQGLGAVADRLIARADCRSYYAHPSVLAQLSHDAAVVSGGISAGVEHGADVRDNSQLEGYVRTCELSRLVLQHGLDSDAARPNVLLRVVDDDVWPFSPGQGSASRSVVAVDLLDSHDPRLRRAGANMLESSRPPLLTAIVKKAVDVGLDDYPDVLRMDLARLLSLVDDPLSMATGLTIEDRRQLGERSEMLEVDQPAWSSLAEESADRGRAALRLLLGG